MLYTLIIAGYLTALVSCKKDLLDTEPKTKIAGNSVFDTPERILAQVYGLYDGLKADYLLGGRYLIYGDIRGEDFINMRNNAATGLYSWNFSVISTTNEVENIWREAYSNINKVNIFLEGLEENAAKITPQLYAQYKAEAKFVRAFCYYNLVVVYARPYNSNNGESPGLPLRLNAEKSTAGNDLARSPVKDIYRQILSDLQEAENNLPLTYSSSLLNVIRAHKNTAIAFKTRIYLSMGQYHDVITESQKIVSNLLPFQAPAGVNHKLEINVLTPFTNYKTTESVFSMPMTDADPPGGQAQLAYYYNSEVGNGEYSLNANGIIADTSWKTTDARRTNFIIAGTTKYFKKFSAPSLYTDYVPVIRYAEILLNYAEAAARTGNLAKALQLLKAVRNRSDESYVFSATAVDTEDKLLKAILIERRIELLGEGFRAIDLLRLGMPFPAKGPVNAVQPSQSQYIWPIPNSEMLTNKLMTQN